VKPIAPVAHTEQTPDFGEEQAARQIPEVGDHVPKDNEDAPKGPDPKEPEPKKPDPKDNNS